MSIKEWRDFGGKRYKVIATWHTRKEAEAAAQSFRNDGYLVRIVKVQVREYMKCPWTGYRIYVRKR